LLESRLQKDMYFRNF